MATDRRSFLRRSLVVLGAVATSGATRRLCAAGETSQPAGTMPGMPGMPSMPGMGTTPALTPDHQVLNAGQSTLTAAELNSAARVGIPGRRWVMVIDLAK